MATTEHPGSFLTYSAGLQELLNICSQYGIDYDIQYNAKKSNIMIVRCKQDKKAVFPAFTLSNNTLEVRSEIKYLGHCISDDLTDDKDILRQRSKLYAQANTLVRKFHMCSTDVKVSLFNAFCTPMYTAHLWCNYRMSSMQKLKVAYNDAFRLLLRVPRWHSASQLFVKHRVPTCEALLRNLMYRFTCRLVKSTNKIIFDLTDPLVCSHRLTSDLWRHWRLSLFRTA